MRCGLRRSDAEKLKQRDGYFRWQHQTERSLQKSLETFIKEESSGEKS
ncbi:MAG: hypothetical protein ACFFDN_41740 [Candidatus Hodarchaeota archaeon]